MKENQKLKIDFLYLDLSVCNRCKETDTVLEEALDELKDEVKGIKNLKINKIKIHSNEEAKKYHFLRSPTVRINDVDIEEILTGKLVIVDNCCDSCSGVTGDSCSEVTGGGIECRCRTFEYKGRRFNSPPKEMIKEAIRKIIS